MNRSGGAWERSKRYSRRLLERTKSLELGLLVAFCLCAFGLWAFAELTDEVLEGDTHAFDRAVLLALRDPADKTNPLGPQWVEEMGRDFTALGGIAVLVVMTFSVTGYLFIAGKRNMALFLAITVIGGMLISLLLKHGFSRPRPDLVPHGSHVYTSSFPSGHSMMAALAYFTLAALLAQVHRGHAPKIFFMGIATLLTVAVGISRVYLGVHWPTDVLGGWAAGTVWAVLCWLGARWLQNRGQIEEAGMQLDEQVNVSLPK